MPLVVLFLTDSFTFAFEQGGQSIFLSFNKSEPPLNEQWFYYVIFKGSKLRHITSAKILNPYTLQAVIPGTQFCFKSHVRAFHDLAIQFELSQRYFSKLYCRSSDFGLALLSYFTEFYAFWSHNNCF